MVMALNVNVKGVGRWSSRVQQGPARCQQGLITTFLFVMRNGSGGGSRGGELR